MKKKTLALLLALAMVVTGLIPSTLAVLAAGSNDQQVILSQNVSPLQQGPSVSASNVSGGGNLQSSGSSEQGGETPAENAAGIELHKTAVQNGDGTYSITMEAFTTGEVTEGKVKPCDIILLLDRSTSMDEKFATESNFVPKYEPELDKNKTYYYKDGLSYIPVYYCNHCEGWFTSPHYSFIFHMPLGEQKYPKTSENDTDSNHVQFYEDEADELTTRLHALKYAANGFIETVAAESPESRIAVVSFGQDAYIHTYKNKNKKEATALLNASTNKAEIESAINGIDADESATEHGKGMEKVKAIFQTYDASEGISPNRQRVVVMITDGEPAPDGTDCWSSRVVKKAVEESYLIKNNEQAAVYCVSVMPGTNAFNPTTPMDKYMSYASSNYPNAKYTGEILDDKQNGGDTYYSGKPEEIIAQITPGDPADISEGGFYLTSNDAASLNAILNQIAGQTGGSEISLEGDTIISDGITPYFNLPADTNAIHVYTQDCLSYTAATGDAEWKEPRDEFADADIQIDNDNDRVTVTGFDFDHNFVAETGRLEGDISQPGDFRGRKLIIEFNISPKPGFLGGNGVPTNTADSGVYKPGESVPVSTFPVPTVDVPLPEISVTAPDKNVYLTNSLTNSDLVYSGQYIIHANSGDITFDFSKPYGGLEYWQFEFLDVGYNLAFGKDGQPLTEDCQYKLDFVLRPKTEGTYGEKRAERATGNIYVYKPVITYEDEKADHGAILDLVDNRTELVWKHGDTVAVPANMDGSEPALGYTYYVYPETEQQVATPETFAFDYWEDQYIKVKVNIAGTDITKYVTFLHIACDITPDCPLTAWQGMHGNTNDAPGQFMIHILNNCFLTINKEAAEGTTFAPGESFIFDVTGPDGYSIRVVLTADENGYVAPVTIEQLYAGEYTVTEDTGWSWRYEAVGSNSETVAISQDNPGDVVIANKLINDNWLHWEAAVDNRWGKNDAGEVVITPHKKPELPEQP